MVNGQTVTYDPIVPNGYLLQGFLCFASNQGTITKEMIFNGAKT